MRIEAVVISLPNSPVCVLNVHHDEHDEEKPLSTFSVNEYKPAKDYPESAKRCMQRQ